MLKTQLVLAARTLSRMGLASGPFGNLSARIPGTDQYWVNPSGIYFDRLREENFVVQGGSSNDRGDHSGVHPGDFIHREIYRMRPDVNAIVHVHSPSTVIFSLLGTEIEPHTQVGAAFAGDQGIYHGFNGPVRDEDEGRAIATALGPGSIVIAKQHGIFAVGPTLQSALWDMVLVDWAAREHLQAAQIGLLRAPALSSEIIEKSRREVREHGAEAFWRGEVEC